MEHDCLILAISFQWKADEDGYGFKMVLHV